MASQRGHKSQELDWISSFAVESNGGSIRPDLFTHSLQEAMNGIGIKIQEAGSCSCFWSHGQTSQLQNACSPPEVLEVIIQSVWMPLGVLLEHGIYSGRGKNAN